MSTTTTMSTSAIANDLFDNLFSTYLQNIISLELNNQKIIQLRYQLANSEEIKLNANPSDNVYLSCKHCKRDVSSNRFAAHLQRCLSRGARR
ncbi:hypothetical protein TBLA_0A00400 [Henningerozyma blattae CBS 6284]|uniref:SAGA-associated factor 11 n=1 Tax=Henningerozyma blattae (strain ATCC 34711 / CBS 6284 / DSM 70876 / NBRC 10599 / NRRL Y-10934 / UCD 77-7) TaxID=1071380 RepID=I2GUN8_HENB6|nr:hypothetical protein TBLA_0A00400 [Tetrapisispora blattae CBS 6284]CCH57840.1 hypothetical protein TBLA_0A00400 [Tetrapisispora blattae CBS 6284]